MKIQPEFSLHSIGKQLITCMIFAWTAGLVCPGAPIPATQSYGQDNGIDTPLSRLKNKYADLLSQAEKKIPRSQKFQILNRVRHQLKSNPKSKNDPKLLIDLANQYKRYRFYKEAIQLFEEVAGNSDNDDASLMQANRWLGEIEYVANDDLDAAIEYTKKAIKYSPKNSLKRGDFLGQLGTYYFIDDRIDEMLEVFADFNRLPEHIKKGLPDSYLKSNLYSARFTKNADDAVEFFERARKIAEANPKEFPPDLILSIFSEQKENLPWNSSERIKRLLVLVENKSYAQEPRIREYAMEIYFAYFLEREKDWKRFDKFAEKVFKLLDEFKSKDSKDTSTLCFQSQALGVFAGASEESKKKWDKSEARQDFQEWQSKLKKMNFYFPHLISQKDLREIMKAYNGGAKLLKADAAKKIEPKNRREKND